MSRPDTPVTTHGPTRDGSRVAPAAVATARSTPSSAIHRSAAYSALPAAYGRTLLREDASDRPVAVSVLAGDPLIGQGVAAHLRAHPEVRVLDAERQTEAEVVLIIVDRITEDTIKLMERAAHEAVAEDVGFVLVGDGLRERHLLRAVSCGLVTVMPRREADLDRIPRALVEVREGRPELPAAR
jgi:hypothetical protein